MAPLPAPPPRRPGALRTLSLRHKGLLVLLAVAALMVLMGTLAGVYRAMVERDFEALERLRRDGMAQARSQVVGAAQADHLDGLARARQAELLARGREVGWLATAVAGGGLGLIGLVVTLFFTRLVADLERLRQRAQVVVRGDRRRERVLQRHDELGELDEALDTMVGALGARERELELERHHAFHQEKMAALGALAAGVLQGIGNPIAAIDGCARAMQEAGVARTGDWADPSMILRETERLQLITRQIAELAAPPSSAPQLLSLNDVVRSALLLLHFDPRLNGLRIDTELDPQLPALSGAADRLLQLVMQLTVNAADAVLAAPSGRSLIVVKTEGNGPTLQLTVADNGIGMTPQVLQRAFEPRFTTKPPGIGTGLGLPLCQAIARQHGGSVSLQSAPGQGTTVTVRLSTQGLSAVASEANA